MLTNTIRTMRALVLTLAATSALAGCAGSSAEQPKTLPAVTASPSPTAVAPSAAPTGINAPTPQGATEFAKFFYVQLEQAFATRNVALIAEISEPGCQSCNNLINSIKSAVDQRARIEGFHVTVTTAVAPAITGPTARVDVVRDSNGVTFLDANGKVLAHEPPLRGIEERMDLVRVPDGWRVAQITRVRVRG